MANYKIDHKNITLTQKRKAIRDVKSLVAKGNTVSKARLLVGRILDVVPATLYNWERKLTGKTTQTKGLAVTSKTTLNGTNTVTKPRITGVNMHIPGKGDITLDHEMLVNISRLAGFTR